MLFVFLSYINKKIPQHPAQSFQIFTTLTSHTLSWLHQPLTLHRPHESTPLKPYISNTLGLTLGTCMKHLFLDPSSKTTLISYLKSEQNASLKIFLYKNFIEVVSTIDNAMEYVGYRTLVYSFQEEILPDIVRQVYPWFDRLAHDMRVN